MMNTQNNPIKQTSVLSAAGVKSVLMLFKLVTLSWVGVASAYASEALFTDAYSSVEAAAKLELSPTVLRSRVVSLNPKSIALNEHEPAKVQQEQIVLNLFDNVNFNAKVDHVEYRSEGNYTVYAKVEGIPFSDVILTSVNGVMAGDIFTPDNFFQIRNVGKDQYAVYEVDQSKFPDEAKSLPLPETVSKTADVSVTPNGVVQPMVDDGSVIDILVVYTTAAKTAAGGVNNILSEINQAIAQTNQVYANSLINHRLRLVGTMEKSYTESTVNTAFTDVTYNMPDVKAKRESLGADLVVLMTQTTQGLASTENYCGQGWEMSSNSNVYKTLAYSVVPRTCATANYSFAHVTARNLGAKPDCFVNKELTSPYPYNHGYVYKTGGWRTVMAYSDECTSFGVTCKRIPYFSNPNVKYNGVATGVYTGSGACESDNRRTFSNTALTVSQYYNGYCDLTGYVERADVKPGASASNLYLRANSLQNSYLQFNTADGKMTDAAIKGLTHRTSVSIRGNQSCLYNTVDYGGQASYLILAP